MAEGIVHINGDADARRCQAVTGKGQCHIVSVIGSPYCSMHGGAKVESDRRDNMAKQYRLAQWQSRVDEFADSSSVKSLREEIGICRMLLENVLLGCKTQTDLLLYSNKIMDLVTRIEKLVVSCNRLESSMGMLLDKSAALNLASQIVSIIAEHISDTAVIDSVTLGITTAVLKLSPLEESNEFANG